MWFEHLGVRRYHAPVDRAACAPESGTSRRSRRCTSCGHAIPPGARPSCRCCSRRKEPSTRSPKWGGSWAICVSAATCRFPSVAASPASARRLGPMPSATPRLRDGPAQKPHPARYPGRAPRERGGPQALQCPDHPQPLRRSGSASAGHRMTALLDGTGSGYCSNRRAMITISRGWSGAHGHD